MTGARLGAVLLCICLGAGVVPGAALADPSEASRFYEDGVVRHRQGDLKGAVVQLKNALQKDTSLLPARMLLGDIYLQLGQGAAAEHEFTLAGRLGADRTLTAEPMARALLLQGKYNAVLEQVDPSKFDRPLAAKLTVLRGHAQAELGKLADAEQTFAQAARLDPDAAGPVVAQAMVALRRGQAEQARKLADQALLMDRTSVDVWSVKASIEHVFGAFDAASSAYAKVLELDPRNLEARVARAGLYVDTQRNQEAREDVEFLKAEFPWDPRAYYLDSLLAQRAGDKEAAREALQRSAAALTRIGADELQRRSPLLLLAGLVHYSLGEYERAIEFLSAYIRKYPLQPGARKLLGAALLATGDHFRAVEVLEPALRAEPDDYRTMELLGMAYMRRGWHVQAAELLDRAAQLHTATPGVRIDAALNRLASGDASAVAELEQVFDQNPDQNSAGMAAAMAYLRQGKSQAALRVAEALQSREPENLTVLSLLASAQVGAGQLDPARRTLERILARDQDFVPARLNLARLDLLQGKPADAQQRLLALLKDHPDHAAAMVELARTAHAQDNPQETLRWLEKARAAAPDFAEPSVLLIDVHLQAGRVAEAMTVAKEALSRQPENLELVLALGRAALAAGDTKQVQSVLSTRSYLAGFDAQWLYRIAALQRAAGANVEAVYTLQKAAKGDPASKPVQVALAESLIAAQRWDEAEAVAASLMRSHPADAQGFRLAGDVQYHRQRYDDALKSFEAALKRQVSPDLAIRVYNTQRARGEPKRAVSYLEAWLAKVPNDMVVRQTLAEAYASEGRAAEAVTQFQQVLDAQPGNVSALNNLAYLLVERDRNQALQLAMRAHGLAPEDAAVNDTLGWILVRRGEPREGLRYLREAQFRDADNPEMRYHLAVALHALGRSEEARVELEKALAPKLPFPGQQAALKLHKDLAKIP